MTNVIEVFAYTQPNPIVYRDINGKCFKEGNRVNTTIKSKEYQVIFTTHHSNSDLKTIYEEFKLSDNKPFWLSENRERLQKFDINVDNLIEIYKNA